jgi:6-phosphogluconolactonase
VARFSATDGRLEPLGIAAELENPSFICVHPAAEILFAVSETSDFRGERSGSLSSWRIDSRTGRLLRLSEVSSGGPGPCHVTLDRTASVVLVANYADGSVATFRVERDGRLEEMAGIHRHEGSSIHVRRQAGPHAHGAFVSPSNRYVVVPDLGADQLYLYMLDAPSAKMRPCCPASVSVVAGTGPRHFAFHPGGRFGYLIGELNSTIVGYRSHTNSAILDRIGMTPATAPEFRGESEAAEIAIDRDGRFLYCSNRGADDIAVFAIGPGGELGVKQRIGCGGRTPRHFALDPTEKFILVANQDSGEVAVFSRDRDIGVLADTGSRMELNQPTCLAFAPCVE